jgi:PKD repeat protein
MRDGMTPGELVMHRNSLSCTRLRALIASVALAASAVALAAPRPLPDFITHPPVELGCDDTPFGRSVTFGTDAEFMEMMATSGSLNAFDEYVLSPDSPPLERAYRADLYPGALAGTTFLKAIGVDLDGDGREEIVTANRVTATGALRLGVFHRTGAPSAELIDTWESSQTFNTVDLAAGDLDGSKDRQQELAVLLRTTNPFGMRVFVLTGAAGGVIAQPDQTAAGTWNREIGGVQNASVTAGDMLLDGRAQIVVVNDSGSGASLALNYNLLEYQPTTSALPVASGDTAIGSKSFQSIVGFTYLADDTTTSPPIYDFLKLDADAGDVVDSAAAELVVHALFEDNSGGDANNYIGQRLHHFIPTRTGEEITSIAFASRGAGMEYDWSHIVQGQNQNGIPTLEATIADVDRVSPAEIVLVRSDPNGRLDVEAYKAKVDVAAYFEFEYTSSQTIHFISQSTGAVTSYHYDFGDGTTLDNDPNPTHHFPADTSYTITLTVHGSYGEVDTYSYAVDAGGGTAPDPTGAPGYKYRTILEPAYSGAYPVSSLSDLAYVNVAAADMDKDGIAEIMTSTRDTTEHWVRSIWHLEDTGDPASFIGQHLVEDGSFGNITAADLVASDFDGDSVKATIATDGCREVVEPQVRQIAWLPPYFRALQADADKAASFGKSISGGSSNEQAWGSYTSHDISAYIGVDIGLDGIGGKVSAKATAGYNYQAATGEIHGTENDQTLTQGWEQTIGEALVVYDENTFGCYTYDLSNAEGPLPDSRARMCELRLHNGVTGDDAQNWDTQIAGGAGTGEPPAQWFPLHRDWANLALFLPVTSNVSLPPDTPASAATDGRFSDSRASNDGATANDPYLEIDLGRVRDITDIRISPPPGSAIDLEGYRLYASASAFAGDGVPSGAGVSEFEPGTGDDMAFDRWNIWTRDGVTFAPMRARFIRLQHPGPATLNVAEIQVFGDVHVEPPAYPEAVCDPVPNDGFFNVKVWDSVNRQFRSIEQHGDLLWTGTDFTPDFPGGCSNWGNDLPSLPIWNTQLIGGSAAATWELGSNSQVAIGHTTSFDSSYRVGAELDVEAGFIATVTAGAAYEFSSGVTEENTTTTYWGTGLQIAGEIGGFDDAALVQTCKYNARPYAYQLVDRSNTGYAHDIYVVDYVVTENGDGAVTAWTRGDVPLECLGLTDEIFASGFD